MSEETKKSRKTILAYLIIAAATVGMIFMGVPLSNAISGASSSSIVTINNENISLQDLGWAQYDTANDGRQSNTALPNLISQILIAQYATQNNFLLSPDVLKNHIKNEFPTPKDYQAFLTQSGANAKAFEAYRNQTLLSSNYVDAIARNQIKSDFSDNVLVSQLSAFRDITKIQLSLSDIEATLAPTKDDLEKYYQAHKADYQTKQTADINYIILDADNFKKDDGSADQESYASIANKAYDIAANNGSLEEIKTLVNADIQSLKNIDADKRDPNWLSNADLKKSLFNNKAAALNTLLTPLSLNENQSIFYVITGKHSPQQLAYDDASSQVAVDYKKDQASKLIKEQSSKVIAALKNNDSIDDATKETIASSSEVKAVSLFEASQDLSAAVKSKILNQGEKVIQIPESNGDIVISVLDKVYNDPDYELTNRQKQSLTLQMQANAKEGFRQSLARWLEDKGKVKVNEKLLSQLQK